MRTTILAAMLMPAAALGGCNRGTPPAETGGDADVDNLAVPADDLNAGDIANLGDPANMVTDNAMGSAIDREPAGGSAMGGGSMGGSSASTPSATGGDHGINTNEM